MLTRDYAVLRAKVGGTTTFAVTVLMTSLRMGIIHDVWPNQGAADLDGLRVLCAHPWRHGAAEDDKGCTRLSPMNLRVKLGKGAYVPVRDYLANKRAPGSEHIRRPCRAIAA